MVSNQRPPVLASSCALRRPVVESAMEKTQQQIEFLPTFSTIFVNSLPVAEYTPCSKKKIEKK